MRRLCTLEEVVSMESESQFLKSLMGKKDTMNTKEVLLGLYRGKPCEQILLTFYPFLFPIGILERTVRNLGALYVKAVSPCITEIKNVEVEIRTQHSPISIREQSEVYSGVWTRTYHTPVGSISEKFRKDSAYGTSDWVMEHLIKKASDYRVVKYILENSTYHENYQAIREAQDDFGQDGIVYALVNRVPLQQLIVGWAGIERFCLDYHDHCDMVEELLAVAQEKERIAYQIAASCPAEVIWSPDNLTEDVTEPKLYEKYLLPFYNEQAKLLHKNGKTYAVHMDGKLRHLADLIGRTEIDVVESFTLPEGGGNLSLEKALRMWKGKTIVANIPASLALQDDDYIKRYIKGLKEKIHYRDNFVLQYSEDIPHAGLGKILGAIADVLIENKKKEKRNVL